MASGEYLARSSSSSVISITAASGDRPMLPASPDPIEGEVVAGRFRLHGVVGRGGMSEVWAAQDLTSDRLIALKLVALDIGNPDDARARFRREAELATELRGPAFVDVIDHGILESRGYLAMELLDGESLSERLRRRRKLPVRETLAMLRALAAGLRVAHAVGVVHRDLKPSNIHFARLTRDDSGRQLIDRAMHATACSPRECVKLLDFGIAKDVSDNCRLTQPGILLGSAFYMSPEQIRSVSDVDSRSDLWSVAVLLYRCLTGVLPFGGEASQALARIISNDPVAPPSTIVPALPRALDAFFEKGLAHEREDRFATIDELVAAFERAAQSGPGTVGRVWAALRPQKPDPKKK